MNLTEQNNRLIINISGQNFEEENASLYENHFEVALASLNAGIWKYDAFQKRLYWSDRCFEITELEAGNATVELFESIIHPDDREKFDDMLSGTGRNQDWFTIDFRINVKKGLRWVRQSGFIFSRDEENKGISVGSMTDITEEKEQNSMVAALKEANLTRDKLFSIIAHDLRSPFSSLLGFAGLLDSEYDDFDDEERKDMIHQIRTSADNTYQLLDNLLIWVKSQADQIQYNPENTDFDVMIKEAVNHTNDRALSKQIQITLEHEKPVKVFADFYMSGVILRNLIYSSIKYAQPNSRIKIRAFESGNSAELEIIEFSREIHENRLISLLHPSGNLNPGKVTNYEKGTGLGLMLMKEFIEKNKGTVTAEIIEGVGSKIILRLPAGI